MSPKTPLPLTFWQLYVEHVRTRASLLIADATLMLLVLLPPLTLALGLTLMAVTEVSQTSLHIAENIDGVWLVIAVGIICLDSTGKLFVISLIGWRETLRKKS